MKCPKCNYPQYCPCYACRKRKPNNYKYWINMYNDIIKCVNCGHKANADWWLNEEFKQNNN